MAYGIKKNKDLVEVYTKEAIDEKIADGSIVGMFAINSTHFGPEVVQTEHIEDGAVTEEKINDFAIKNKHLGPEVVEAGNIAEDAIYKIGTYIGDGDNSGIREITGLGFRPKMVIVMSSYYTIQQFIFENGWNMTYYDSDTGKVDSSGTSEQILTDDGFEIAYENGVDEILNSFNQKYTYIAFR